MRFVHQRFGYDCGIATAAMLSGRTYEEVRAAARGAGLLATSGTAIVRLVKIIELCPGAPWEARKRASFRPLAEQPEVISSQEAAGLLLRGPAPDDLHWIAAGRGWLYDPSGPFPLTMSLYPQRGWIVRRILAQAR